MHSIVCQNLSVRISTVLVMACLFCGASAAAQNAPAANDWKAVEQTLGRSGQLQGDGAYKFGLPRGDLKVTVDGVQVKPTLALGSWVAFSSPGQDAMLMGDLVLAEDEVSPVMLALQENGLQITALHNHILHETPRVMYMHIAGHGAAVQLADAVRKVIALTKTPAPAHARALHQRSKWTQPPSIRFSDTKERSTEACIRLGFLEPRR